MEHVLCCRCNCADKRELSTSYEDQIFDRIYKKFEQYSAGEEENLGILELREDVMEIIKGMH